MEAELAFEPVALLRELYSLDAVVQSVLSGAWQRCAPLSRGSRRCTPHAEHTALHLGGMEAKTVPQRALLHCTLSTWDSVQGGALRHGPTEAAAAGRYGWGGWGAV